MNKNVKGIVVGSIVLVVLSGALVALKLAGDDNSSSELSSVVEIETKTLISEWAKKTGNDGAEYTDENVESVDISNDNGSYKVVRNENSDASKYTISDLEKYKMDVAKLDSMPNAALNSKISTVVEENAEDLVKYGLDTPVSEIKITLDDGKEIKFLIGDASPVEGEVYFCYKDDNTVYATLTSTANAFLYSKEYYLSLLLIEEVNDSSLGMAKLRVDRADLDYDIAYEAFDGGRGEDYSGGTSSNAVMTEPIFAYLDVMKSVDITNAMFGLTASAVVQLEADEEDLKLAGLDNPFCVVKMDTKDGKEYTLRISKMSESSDSEEPVYFGYLEGTDIIYAFSQSQLVWITMNIQDPISPIIIADYFYLVGGVSVEVEGKESMIFTGSGKDKSDYKATLNGVECSTERFRQFYTFLLNTPAEEIYMGEVTGEPVAEINVETQDGKKTELKFYRDEGRKLIITVNGVTSFKCRDAYLNVLTGNMDIFDTEKNFTVEW